VNDDIIVRLNTSVLDIEDDGHLLGCNARVEADVIATVLGDECGAGALCFGDLLRVSPRNRSVD
jgi:hypothetical protein